MPSKQMGAAWSRSVDVVLRGRVSARVLAGVAGERRARSVGIARTAIPAKRKAFKRRISQLISVVICRRRWYRRDQV